MGDTDSVTISLLPVSLSLVHLPRSRLEHFTSHILRQILQPNPTFLNVTCNEVEISLFSEHDTLSEFHKAAREDARTARQRERDSNHPGRPRQDWEPVEVTCDRWKVMQIDSHSDRLDTSGARVHELSAPLAAAGISILYQSSYMSDFIFVKEDRLAEVMTLLHSAGFDIYRSDSMNLAAEASAFTSPIWSSRDDDDKRTNTFDLRYVTGSRDSFDPDGGVVFTRSRSNTSTTSSSESRSRAMRQALISPTDSFIINPDCIPEPEPQSSSPYEETRPAFGRYPSHSPSSCDVRVLSPDITCVGLSDDSADVWGLKVVKLVAFPELIMEPFGAAAPLAERRARPREPAPIQLSALPEEHIHIISLSEGEPHIGSDTTTQVAPDSPTKNLADRSGSISPPLNVMNRLVLDDSLDTDDSSLDEDASGERPKLPHLDTTRTVKPQISTRPSRSRSLSSSSSISSPAPLVPFFSFTRTPEGSSLAAPVSLLAALFPASERHMVMCSEELDVLDSRNASPERWDQEGEDAVDEDEDVDGDLPEPEGMLKCLQIDLRKFGLEKHGLVNRFSRVLEESGINHMYSSTYKTANLLIDKAHASRAQALLRSC